MSNAELHQNGNCMHIHTLFGTQLNITVYLIFHSARCIMTAASVYMAGANMAYEDYSIYSNLSEDDLIQLAIERSLADLFRPSSVPSQRTTQGSSSSSSSSGEQTVPTFQQVQGHFRAQRQAALHTQNIDADLPQTDNFPR